VLNTCDSLETHHDLCGKKEFVEMEVHPHAAAAVNNHSCLAGANFACTHDIH
jgi:hypothetical protein